MQIENKQQTQHDEYDCTLIILERILFVGRTKSIDASVFWGYLLIFQIGKLKLCMKTCDFDK